jgi:PAS domain S-box-containing protein
MKYHQRVNNPMQPKSDESNSLTVLCLEDSPKDAEIIRESLVDSGYNLKMECTATEIEFVSMLKTRTYDVILADFKLPGFDAFAALQKTMEICPHVPFICVSGSICGEDAIELLKQGAADYIIKDRLEKLPSAIQRVLDEVNEKKALRQAEEFIISQNTLLTALINSPNDLIIFSLDRNYCFTTFNEKHRAEMKRVWNTDINIGMNLLDCMHIPELRESAKQSIDCVLKGESFFEIQHQPEPDIYYEFSWNPIWQNKEVVGATVFIKDITERKKAEEEIKKSLEEKVVLLKEIHHRVKNNLQIILSLISIQSVKNNSSDVNKALESISNRIRSISIVHELIYQSDNFSVINIAKYISMLTGLLLNQKELSRNVSVEIDTGDICFDVNMMIPLGAIINELSTNAIKYAFPDGKGIIRISITSSGDVYTLVFHDNGKGFDENVDMQSDNSLGLTILHAMVRQIHGDLNIEKDGGTKVTITFREVKLSTYGDMSSHV